MGDLIPPKLDDGEPVFIRLGRRSKAPIQGNSADSGPFFRVTDTQIQAHIQNGGNVARVFHDEFVAIDVDHQELLDEIKDWPNTLVIESGGADLGYHYYYRVPTWDYNQRELTSENGNIGSIRSGHSYCVVPPSVHDKSKDRYVVAKNSDVAEIGAPHLSNLLHKFSSGTANTGGGAAAGAGGSRQGADEELPDEYPNREATWSTTKAWLRANDLLYILNQTFSSDWSGDEFLVAKCLAEGGFSKTAISNVLDRLHHKSKWHRRGTNYQDLTVQKAIEAACNDPYVEFSETADMDGKTSERRKTEESGSSPTLRGGDSMSSNNFDYTSKERFVVYNADSPGDAEDGDRVVRVELTNMDGTDDDGKPVDTDFVTVTKGKLREDGEFGVSPEFPGQSKSVGSADPEDLRLIADGLEQMADELE